METESFNIWNEIKKALENLPQKVQFKEREIWYARIGKNIGSEQNGRGNEFLRPLVILKRFNKNLFLAIPLSRTQKNGIYYFEFLFQGRYLSKAIVSQIRLFDSKRLSHKIGFMEESVFQSLKNRVKEVCL